MKDEYKKSRKINGFIEIFGLHAVQAALKNSKRIHQKLIISLSLQDKFRNLEHKVNKIITCMKFFFYRSGQRYLNF